jgi:hypothetical protein
MNSNSSPSPNSVPSVGFDVQGNLVEKSDEQVIDVNKAIPADIVASIQVGETGLKPIVEHSDAITDDDTKQ